MFRYVLKPEEVEEGMKLAEPVYANSMMVVQEGAWVTGRIIQLLRRHSQIEKVAVYTTKERKAAFVPPKEQPKKELPKIKPIVTEDFCREAVKNIRTLFTAISAPDEKKVNMTTAYQLVSDFDTVLNQLVSTVSTNPLGFVHIYDLKRYDEYTYHHSLSVALLAIATGQALGYDFLKLMRLGQCAVLHDIGKQQVPLEIMNKRGKLTTDEFTVMKEHAIRGAAMLKNKAFGNTELWMGIKYHHEKYNGNGYPEKLVGDEIPEFSRIISIGDVYDAVTSYRPYRDPMTPTEAYKMIAQEVGSSFDYRIVEAFTRRLILYPENTMVELSDGRVGIVIANDNDVLYPVVRIQDSDTTVDLAKDLSVSIKKVR